MFPIGIHDPHSSNEEGSLVRTCVGEGGDNEHSDADECAERSEDEIHGRNDVVDGPQILTECALEQ